MLKREDSKSTVSPQMQIIAVLPPTFLPSHSFSIFSTFLKDSEAELAAVKIRILSLHQMCPYLIMCSHGNKYVHMFLQSEGFYQQHRIFSHAESALWWEKSCK